MIARLWWKEARIFWPLWVFVALIAVAVQCLVLWYFGGDARDGALGVMAVGWACLYGFAVASAAFAGEREGRTLVLLDAHAVSRLRLWGSKVSFALATTLGLAAVLVGIAALATDRWHTGPTGPVTAALACGVVLMEALGWGLLWSAISASALTAAALAVCSMGAFQMAMLQVMWLSPTEMVSTTMMRLCVALATTGASAVILAWDGPGRWARGRSSGLPRRTGQRRSASRRMTKKGKSTQLDAGELVGAPSSRPAVTAAVGSLAWLTMREAFPLWWRIMALILGTILASLLQVYLYDGTASFMGWLLLANPAIAILAGVNVFGTEARARTHRFLAHHGVSPGLAWCVKIAVWAGALASVWGVLAAAFAILFFRRGFHDAQTVPLYAAILINGFVVAQFCGMAIRRGITAALVATLALVAVMVPVGGLNKLEMLPSWGLFAICPALLLVGWSWSRDWLLDRPGPARWVRLCLLLATSLGLLFIGYVVYRVESVPDLRSTLARDYLRVSVPSPETSTTPDSAVLYREAARRLTPSPPAVRELYVDPASDVIRGIGKFEAPTATPAWAWLRENTEVLALIRRASVLPRGSIAPIERQTLFSTREPINFRGIALLVVVSHHERLERGDLAGAWDDLAVLLRMARHLNGPVPIQVAVEGLYIEQRALGLAMNWAVDSRQTRGQLHTSRAEYRRLQIPFSDVSDTIRIEARLAEQTLNLPRAEFAERLLAAIGELRRDEAAMAAWAELVTTRWEIARARRAFPLLFAAKAYAAGFEPSRRNYPGHLTGSWNGLRAGSGRAAVTLSGEDLSYIQKSTPLVQLGFPRLDAFIDDNDRNEVARRALIQILALRSWQVQHGGRLPDRLVELIPSELDRLPMDPYSDNAFGYVPSEGQPLLPLGRSEPLPAGFRHSELIPTAGHRLLYSFGPNRLNDHARVNLSRASSSTDIIFPLPESVPVKGEDAAKVGADPKVPLP